ncbi:hypothetical protein AAFP35_13895 [Gordonia sp. CPCC 206044]|uniref:hypothetical protein n=1 Tax=Gordonia sp. CPCC 206044 TaxID=3140793 RepID=UPI003AF3AB53
MIATDPLEAIEYAGGWLFDQSMAGWDVSVHVTEGGDLRPLAILGASMFELRESLARRTAFDQPGFGPWPQAVAVSAKVIADDERILSGATASIDKGLTDIRLWGDGLPTGLDDRCRPVSHRLSVAAQAFKRRALCAAHVDPDSLTSVELFREAAEHAGTPRRSGLVPAS